MTEKFYMDVHEEIRFRVTNINFTRVTKTATGATGIVRQGILETHTHSRFLSWLRSTAPCLPGIQATTTEASDKAAADGDMRQSLARRRSSSVDLSDTDPTPSAIHILVRVCGNGRMVWCGWVAESFAALGVVTVQGTIDEDGLGLTSWWVN